MTATLYPDAFLSPLVIDEAVTRALDEDLGRAGDVTSTATVPVGTRARAVVAARRPGVISGLPLVEAALRKLDPAVGITAQACDGDAVEAGASAPRRRRRCPRRARCRARRAQLPRPSLRHRHGDGGLRPPHRRHQCAGVLHPQDDAGPARAREIRRALRRRLQSPVRARRRDPHQGQPHRGRRRHPRGARSGAGGRRPPRQDRDRGRYARAVARGARQRPRRRRAARQHGCIRR